MTSDRCWHSRAHRRPCGAGSRPVIIGRILIIAVSTIIIVAAISTSSTTSSGTSGSGGGGSGGGGSGGGSGARRGSGGGRDGGGDRRPGHGQSAALFCVRDRYRMAETEFFSARGIHGIPNAVRVASGD
jgi:hypothetical protein